MNDDELERRLRRALDAEAREVVRDERPLPAMSRPSEPTRAPLRALPLLAAAVVVTAIVAGSTVLVRLNGHVTPHNLDSASTPPVATSGPLRYVTGSASPTRSAHPGPTRSTNAPSGGSRTTTTPGVSSATVPPPAGTSTSAPPTQEPPSHTGPRSTRPTGHPSSSPRRTPTTSAPSGPSSSPPASQVLPCTSASLTLAVGGDRLVGANGDYTFLELTNSGPTCSLDGYPVVRIDDPADHLVAGPASHRASPAAQEVVLTRGKAAEFELYDVMSSAPSCTANYSSGRTLQMSPPGQSTPITIGYGYSACGLSVTSIHLPQAHPVTE